jgi:hypothetical protein
LTLCGISMVRSTKASESDVLAIATDVRVELAEWIGDGCRSVAFARWPSNWQFSLDSGRAIPPFA